MSEENGHDSLEQVDVGSVLLDRILWLIVATAATGSVFGAIFHSGRFGVGILIGAAVSALNYVLLRSSIRVLLLRAEEGTKPQLMVVRYFLRYLIFAGVLLVVYLTDLLPVMAVLIGMASFAFAIVLEGLRSSVLSARRSEGN